MSKMSNVLFYTGCEAQDAKSTLANSKKKRWNHEHCHWEQVVQVREVVHHQVTTDRGPGAGGRGRRHRDVANPVDREGCRAPSGLESGYARGRRVWNFEVTALLYHPSEAHHGVYLAERSRRVCSGAAGRGAGLGDGGGLRPLRHE